MPNYGTKQAVYLNTIGIISAVFLAAGLIAVPAIAIASQYEATRGVKLDIALKGVRGTFTVKTVSLTNDHKDYFVYLNFNQDSATIGSGYAVWLNPAPTYFNLIYWKLAAGGVNHDMWSSTPVDYTFLADVRQTVNGSNCFKATTFNGNNETFCMSPTTKWATVAAAIARSQAQYSASNTMSGVVDYLGTAHYSGGYIWKYFTDAITNESKCYSTDTPSTNSYIEQELLKRAPTGSPSDKFDKLGFGPTLYTTDSCSQSPNVWGPFGSY